MEKRKGGEDMKEVEQDYCNLCLEVDGKGQPTGGQFCKNFYGGRMVFKKLLTPEGSRQFWSAQSTGKVADCGKFQAVNRERSVNPVVSK